VAIILLGGVAGIAALVLALLTGGTLRRTLVLLAIGLGLTAAWLVAIYLSARPTSESADCSDCGAHLGRWLDAAAIVIVVGGNAVAWTVGVLVGSGLRAARRAKLDER
jgi:hypothetical protein